MPAPLPEKRRQAERMWRAGLSRGRIAHELDLPPNTISHWRWQEGWPARRDYGTRPIAPRPPKRERQRARSIRHYACPGCGTRAPTPEGHDCCVRAA